MSTILVCLLLTALAILAIRYIWKKRATGGCVGCSGCSHSSSCSACAHSVKHISDCADIPGEGSSSAP